MASNSNSERTNVITMLCFKLERFTQPCFLPFIAAEPRAHRCVRWVDNNAFNFLAVKDGCYMGLQGDMVNGKEWAMRIMGNVINFGERKEVSLALLKLLYPAEKDQ